MASQNLRKIRMIGVFTSPGTLCMGVMVYNYNAEDPNDTAAANGETERSTSLP
jgi:hypothetical protein